MLYFSFDRISLATLYQYHISLLDNYFLSRNSMLIISFNDMFTFTILA